MKISPGMARDLGNEVRGGQIYFSLLFYLTIKCKLYNLTFGPFWAKKGGGHSDGIESLTDHSWKIDFGRTYYSRMWFIIKNKKYNWKYISREGNRGLYVNWVLNA